ncbi:MAG: TIGR03668 family PPOX class F420-dependent oxidoreductase [Dehalococcoidia bacterium]|nr:TIGR03668 family PPOX class F420-dependent oxidoreductase [Dehalococcoidia bacterium]
MADAPGLKFELMSKSYVIDSDVKNFVSKFRVARLATSDNNSQPNVVPICFEIGGNSNIYTAIDKKSKVADYKSLKRIRNIIENPKVSLLFDKYTENWNKLSYVLIRGNASLQLNGHEQSYGERLLRGKYDQYEEYLLPGSPIIVIKPEYAHLWGHI